MAEEPLFGFEGASRRDKLLENVVSGVVIVFVGLTILFCLINSGKSAAHFFLGVTLALLTSCEVQLVRWYKLGDIDPKFKWLILGLGVSLVMLAGLANAYVWAPGLPASLGACSGPDDPNVHGALGLYDTATGQCYLKCDASFLLDRTTGVVGTCFPKNQNSTSMFFS